MHLMGDNIYTNNISNGVGKSGNDLCTRLFSIISTIIYILFGTAIPTSLNNLLLYL